MDFLSMTAMGSAMACDLPTHADVSMKSRTVFSRDVDLLSCEIVGLLQPGDQLFINVVDAVQANAMGE